MTRDCKPCLAQGLWFFAPGPAREWIWLCSRMFSLPDCITQTCLQSPSLKAAQSAFPSPPSTQESPQHHSMLPQMWIMWAMLICLAGGQPGSATLCRTYGTIPGIPGLPGQPGSDGRDGENGPKGEQGKEEAAGG